MGVSDDDSDVEEGEWAAVSGSKSVFGTLWESWQEAGWGSRLLSLTSLISHVLLRLTVPMVEDGEWSFWGCIITPTTACVFVVASFGEPDAITAFVGPIPLMVIPLAVGLCFSVAVAVAQFKTPETPLFRTGFALLAFLSAIAWISAIAQELISVLAALGTIVGVSDAILGLSVLAWGNSLGDLIADRAVAIAGMAQMGVAAAYSSPMLNMLIGVGLSLTIKIASTGEPFAVQLNSSIAVAIIALIVSLVSSIVYIPANGFAAGPRYGIYLAVVYAIAFTLAVVFEFE